MLVGLTVVLTTLTTLAAVAASSQFFDVSPGDTHLDGITFMVDSGVTVGCAANAFCPDEPVPRAQMATFMHRLSGTDPHTDPSVNAATLDGRTAEQIEAAALAEVPRLISARVSSSGEVLHAIGIGDAYRSGNVFIVEIDGTVDDCSFSATAQTPLATNAVAGFNFEYGDGSNFLVTFRDTDGSVTVPAWDLVGICVP